MRKTEFTSVFYHFDRSTRSDDSRFWSFSLRKYQRLILIGAECLSLRRCPATWNLHHGSTDDLAQLLLNNLARGQAAEVCLNVLGWNVALARYSRGVSEPHA